MYCGAATVVEDRSGMKCLRSRNGEARQLKCKGRVCREEGGSGEKIHIFKKNNKILRADLPAILKSNFPSIWFLTACNQLIFVLSMQVFDHLR